MKFTSFLQMSFAYHYHYNTGNYYYSEINDDKFVLQVEANVSIIIIIFPWTTIYNIYMSNTVCLVSIDKEMKPSMAPGDQQKLKIDWSNGKIPKRRIYGLILYLL